MVPDTKGLHQNQRKHPFQRAAEKFTLRQNTLGLHTERGRNGPNHVREFTY